ncbi:MAG: M20/M25/M40 family metallo-hydrolase [Anaerolineae bacterium]|nr:M20/M25/M40 family metallo-hydrolase [Anaerolineae bacterium]
MNDHIDWNAVREDAAATLSRYVQFDTTNPPGRELQAAQWMREQVLQRQITNDVTVYEPTPGRGLVMARIPGADSLKPLLLTHHIDVVAADGAQWTHPPFSGAIADGFVWGRGTLDTKNLGIIFLLALELLRKEGATFKRGLIFQGVPDEETGGEQGMRWLVEHHLDDLDPAWVWDEGSGGFEGVFGEGILFGVSVSEKRIQHLKLVAEGDPGHASMPHANNPSETLARTLSRLLERPRPMRLSKTTATMFKTIAKTQRFPNAFILRHLANPLILRLAAGKLATDPLLNALLRDTVSVTVLNAGQKVNVIPERAEAQVDCRLLPETDAAEFHHWLRRRLDDDRVKVEIAESSPASGIAPLDTPFYEAVRAAVERHVPGADVFPIQMPGATDGRYFRQRGYAAYGLSPMILGPGDLKRVHGIDERISLDNLTLGIKIARDVIRTLCVD